MAVNPESSAEKNLAHDCKIAEEHPLVSDLLEKVGGKCPDAITQAPDSLIKKTLSEITPLNNTPKTKPKRSKR